MGIEKLKFVNIFGGVDSFGAVAAKLYRGTEFHPEQATGLLKDLKGFFPFSDIDPYREVLQRVNGIIMAMGREVDYRGFDDFNKTDTQIQAFLNEVDDKWGSLQRRRDELDRQLMDNRQILKQLSPIIGIETSLEELFSFEYVKVRVGRLPRDSYDKLVTNIEKNPYLFHIPCSIEKEYVWGIFFAPRTHAVAVDSMLASLHFYRTRISGRAEGTPAHAYDIIERDVHAVEREIERINADMEAMVIAFIDTLQVIHSMLSFRCGCFDIRRYAARTAKTFYITGWCPESTADQFKSDVEEISGMTCVLDTPTEDRMLPLPPTKLKNKPPFRPFEFFTKMYGLPRYGEFDPTPLVAISYTILFGIMFGDVGQGALLSALGIFLWVKRRMALGRIIGIIGVSSMIFGFFYGSVFGKEDLIHGFNTLDKSNINITLMASVALGVFMISIAIILNIINGIRQKDREKIFFSNNGLAGLIFYWAVIIAVVGMMLLGINLLTPWFLILFCALPLIAIFLKEPLGKLMAGKADWMPKKKGEFFLEGFFELFEVVLSFITTTISYLRVGAYAMSHVGMMSVVYMLARGAGGSENIVVIIFGNLLVVALEGLIVGIQCLRLEFYELFSRFFDGTGRAFSPLSIDYGGGTKTKK